MISVFFMYYNSPVSLFIGSRYIPVKYFTSIYLKSTYLPIMRMFLEPFLKNTKAIR